MRVFALLAARGASAYPASRRYKRRKPASCRQRRKAGACTSSYVHVKCKINNGGRISAACSVMRERPHRQPLLPAAKPASTQASPFNGACTSPACAFNSIKEGERAAALVAAQGASAYPKVAATNGSSLHSAGNAVFRREHASCVHVNL